MGEMFFDIFSRADPNGTALGELTQAFEKQVRVVDNAIGTGLLKINRHDSQYAWCATDNLVRVRLVAGGPFAYNDSRYIFAFWIEEGGDALLSQDEQGGETVARGGRGGEVALRWAQLWQTAFLPGNVQFTTTTLKDGYWHITNRTPGEVLRIVLRDAPARSPDPISFLGHDFLIAHDSAGVAWSDTDTDWALPVGASFLDILGTLVSSGLIYKMDPDLTLHAYENSQAVNRSSSVKFAKGVNIAEAADRDIHASPAVSRVLVRGTTKNGTLTYQTVIDSTIEAAIGRREGYVEYQATPTTARLTKAGQRAIAKLKRWHDGPTTLNVVTSGAAAVAAGAAYTKEAFVDYFPGDSVELHIPGEFEHTTQRVFGISLSDRDTGDYDVTLEFEQSPFDPSTGDGATGDFGEPGTGTGHGCNDCPPLPPFTPCEEGSVALVQEGRWEHDSATADRITGLTAATAGNVWVACVSSTGNRTSFPWGSEWTQILHATLSADDNRSGYISVAYRPTTVGETTVILNTGGSAAGAVTIDLLEWSGLGSVVQTATDTFHPVFPYAPGYGLGPVAGGVIVMGWGRGTHLAGGDINDGTTAWAGFTNLTLYEIDPNTSVSRFGYKAAASSSGTFSRASNEMRGAILGLWAMTCVSGNAVDGQPARGVLPVETPDGATDTFTAPTAMASQSLERVTVDGIDETDEVLAVDYTAKTVQLTFTPESDEELRFWYTVGSA